MVNSAYIPKTGFFTTKPGYRARVRLKPGSSKKTYKMLGFGFARYIYTCSYLPVVQCRIPSLSVRLESPEASEGQGVSLAVQVIKYAMCASCVQTHSSPQWPLQPFCEPKVSNPTSWTDDGRPKSQYIAFNVKKRLVWAQDARDRQGVILLQHATANNLEVLYMLYYVFMCNYLYDAHYMNVFDDMFILICFVY